MAVITHMHSSDESVHPEHVSTIDKHIRDLKKEGYTVTRVQTETKIVYQNH